MCCIINYKKRNVIDRFWQIFTFYLLLLSWFSCSFWAKSQEWPEKNPLLKLFILTTDIVMFVFIDLQEVHPNLQLSIIAIICTWLRVCLKIFRKGNLWEAKGRLNVYSFEEVLSAVSSTKLCLFFSLPLFILHAPSLLYWNRYQLESQNFLILSISIMQ